MIPDKDLFINEALKREYDFYLRKISGLTAGGIEKRYPSLTVEEILKAHFLICDYFLERGENIGGIGPRDINLLISATNRQHTSYRGVDKWKNHFERCASLFFGLIKNHPFHDANKRTAFLSAIYFLWKIRRIPTAKRKLFEELTIKVADNTLYTYSQYERFLKTTDPEIYFIAYFFKRNTRELDKQIYLITYRQLNTLLHNYGYSLENPHKNFIDVVKNITPRKKFLFRSTPIPKKTKIDTIVFPGWGRVVEKNTIKRILKKTEIRKSGIDSGAFFKGENPLPALIDQYHPILEKLKDK